MKHGGSHFVKYARVEPSNVLVWVAHDGVAADWPLAGRQGALYQRSYRMHYKKESAPAPTVPQAEETMFDAVAGMNEEALMMTVNEGRLRVYVRMGRQGSKLAEALRRVAQDTLQMAND